MLSSVNVNTFASALMRFGGISGFAWQIFIIVINS